MDPARDSAAPGATGAQDNDQAQKHSKPPGLTAQQFDELLEWALRYAAAGLAVFPCGADKRPLTEHGFLDATTNPDVIRAWWRRLPGALIGVAIPAGYVVVDVDGAEGWAALEGEGLTLPATLTACTGRGEFHRHLWCRLPLGAQLHNAVELLPHVDIRTVASYCIMPPSCSVYGPYTWLGEFDLGAVTECPTWVLERAHRGEAEAAAPVGEWRELVAGVPEGRRNATAARITGHLLRRHVDPVVTLELVRCWNAERCSPALPDDEVVRTVDSIARRELQRRGGAA